MNRDMLNNALNEMRRHAEEIKVSGVGVAGFLEDGNGIDWNVDMRVVNALKFVGEDGEGFNFVGVAFQKACEMMDTKKDSGSGARDLLHGECGWQGGAIRKLGGGYVMAAFSGGTSEQDYEISTVGVEFMIK